MLLKKPDALYFYFDDRSFEPEFVKGLFQSVGLFSEQHIVVLDRVSAVFDIETIVEDMSISSHIFILFKETVPRGFF